jgi:hypothetical protein
MYIIDIITVAGNCKVAHTRESVGHHKILQNNPAWYCPQARLNKSYGIHTKNITHHHSRKQLYNEISWILGSPLGMFSILVFITHKEMEN